LNRAQIDDARAIFDRRVQAWLAEDVDAYLACWHDDMVITLPHRDAPLVGIDLYRALVERSFAWAKPVSFDVHALAVCGRSEGPPSEGPAAVAEGANGMRAERDVVLAEWTIRAERRADHVMVEWSGMSACEIRDGRITWWREYYRRPPQPP
jgi:ketosteroid isomerase-like protein